MSGLTINNHVSTLRVKKHRDSKIKSGFKRIQKWVFDIESIAIQELIKKDLLNYRKTHEEKEWNKFAADELKNIEGWE